MTSPSLLYSETERDLAAALSDLLAAAAAPADVLARTEQPETYDAKLWRTVAAEIGIAGLLIPEPLGGAGASYRELAAAAEQFGAAVAPIPYLGSAAVATAALLSAARSAAAAETESAGQGPAAPWRLHQNYPRDVLLMRHGSLEDKGMRFSRAPAAVRAVDASLA